MGGRGSSSSGGRNGGSGSSDGVFQSKKTTTVETRFMEARGYSKGYFKDEVLEAKTDGKGNITFDYATAKSFDKSAKTNRTNYVTYELSAGAVNGQTFNINWDKVQTVSGKTFSVKDQAKAAGMKWDGKNKRWTR